MSLYHPASLLSSFLLLVLINTSVTAQSDWEPIGPASVELRSFAANSDYLFGSQYLPSTALYRSSDRGATWEKTILPRYSSHYLSVVHADDEVVLLVEVSQARGRYMYRSTDNGETWEDVLMEADGISSQRYSCVRIGNTVYAHYADHLSIPFVAFSDDQGRYWNHLRGGDLDLLKLSALHAVSDTLVLVAEDDSGGALFLTADTGRTWTIRRLPNDEGSWFSVEVDGRIVLAKSRSPIMFTDDLGQTWQNSTMPADEFWIGLELVGARGTVILPGFKSALYSRDTGRTWHMSDASYPDTYPRFSGNTGHLRNGIWTGDGFVFGHSDAIGIFHTDWGEMWTSFGQGLPQTAPIFGMTLFENQILILSDNRGSDNFFRSTDAGSTWRVNEEQARPTERGPLFSTSRGFFQGRDDALYFSRDGRSWEKLEGTPARVQQFSLADSTILAWTDPGQLWHSTDLGLTWTRITSITERARAAVIFEGLYLVAGIDLFRSNDSGTTWDTVRMENGRNIYVSGIARSGPHLYAVSSHLENGVLYSADSGKSWQNIMDRIPFNWEPDLVHLSTTLFSFDSVVVLNVHHEFVRNSFISTDHGITWQRLGSAADTVLQGPINRMVRVGDELIAQMDGRTAWNSGLYRTSISHLLSSVETRTDETVSSRGEIRWNRSDDTFDWMVAEQGEAELHLFDLFGRKVARLYRGLVREGWQSRVALPGKSVVSGTYFVVLMLEGQVVDQVMLQVAY